MATPAPLYKTRLRRALRTPHLERDLPRWPEHAVPLGRRDRRASHATSSRCPPSTCRPGRHYLVQAAAGRRHRHGAADRRHDQHVRPLSAHRRPGLPRRQQRPRSTPAPATSRTPTSSTSSAGARPTTSFETAARHRRRPTPRRSTRDADGHRHQRQLARTSRSPARRRRRPAAARARRPRRHRRPQHTIAEIQGTGDTSPLVGQPVITQGVVTAAYPTGGFFGYVLQTDGTGSRRPTRPPAPPTRSSSTSPRGAVTVHGRRTTCRSPATVSEFGGPRPSCSVDAADVQDLGTPPLGGRAGPPTHWPTRRRTPAARLTRAS